MRGMIERFLFPFILIITTVLLIVLYTVCFLPYWVITGKDFIIVIRPYVNMQLKYGDRIYQK